MSDHDDDGGDSSFHCPHCGEVIPNEYLDELDQLGGDGPCPHCGEWLSD